MSGTGMPARLLSRSVGPWPMNTYLVVCEETEASAIIDPGADPAGILALASGTQVEKILITHSHFDHIGALSEIRAATQAPVFMHPAEAVSASIDLYFPLFGGEIISVGRTMLGVIHTPGHTPGMLCFDLRDGRVLVGDTVFVGGPGHTRAPQDFSTTLMSMQEKIFTWPDDTIFYPGHGPAGRIGAERPAFLAFLERGWSIDLCGDVTWV